MSKKDQERKPFTGEHAKRYDQMAGKAGWLDPDILLGLAYRYISPGETVLDVGIGTGLASALFHKAGLKIIGLDRSGEMLAVCRQKGFAEKLFEQDVTVAPYPLADDVVDHAVCSGVLHIFEDISVVFSEVGRIMKKGGVFAFVVAHTDAPEVEPWHVDGQDGYPSASLYRHPLSVVSQTAESNGFEMLQSLHYASSVIRRQKMAFNACIVRKL